MDKAGKQREWQSKNKHADYSQETPLGKPSKARWTTLKRVTPQDQDIVLRIGNLSILEARFLEPHAFLFDGIAQNGHRSGIVVHYTQAPLSVVFLPKRLRDKPRVVTGFVRL